MWIKKYKNKNIIFMFLIDNQRRTFFTFYYYTWGDIEGGAGDSIPTLLPWSALSSEGQGDED